MLLHPNLLHSILTLMYGCHKDHNWFISWSECYHGMPCILNSPLPCSNLRTNIVQSHRPNMAGRQFTAVVWSNYSPYTPLVLRLLLLGAIIKNSWNLCTRYSLIRLRSLSIQFRLITRALRPHSTTGLPASYWSY